MLLSCLAESIMAFSSFKETKLVFEKKKKLETSNFFKFIQNDSMKVKEIKETPDGQNLILMSTAVHSYITYYYFLNFNLV